MKKALGWLMLVSLFVTIFMLTGSSFLQALATIALGVMILAVAYVSIELITSGG